MAEVVLMISGVALFGSMLAGVALMIFGMLSTPMSRDQDLEWANVVRHLERVAIAGVIGIAVGAMLYGAGL